MVGSVDGSPIVAGNLFVGFEHPLSQSKVTGDRATAWIDRDLPLRAGQSVTYSSVIGVAREGQMRRDFLAYLERERAHPYRTFLHYNSLVRPRLLSRRTTEADALDRVNAFGRELTEKRGVKLDSFLFDDGWDNHESLWKFNSGFPEWVRAGEAGGGEIRRRSGRLDVAVGRLLQAEAGADRVRQGAGTRSSTADMRCRGRSTTRRFRDVCAGDDSRSMA